MHKIQRRLFTQNENMVIFQSVKLIGEEWEIIAKILPGRTPKQIQDRYKNYLREDLKKEPFSNEEDQKTIELFKQIGPKWTKMMNSLPGRSGNDIKNRFHKHLNKSNIYSNARQSYNYHISKLVIKNQNLEKKTRKRVSHKDSNSKNTKYVKKEKNMESNLTKCDDKSKDVIPMDNSEGYNGRYKYKVFSQSIDNPILDSSFFKMELEFQEIMDECY